MTWPLISGDDAAALEGAACYSLARPDRDSKIGPDLWFATDIADQRNGTTGDAIQVCRQCPVRMECLRVALKNNEDHGVWGGFNMSDPAERKRARAMLGTPAPVANRCGTDPGYFDHRRRGEETCADCRKAHRKHAQRKGRGAA